jgi:hypothetical protein
MAQDSLTDGQIAKMREALELILQAQTRNVAGKLTNWWTTGTLTLRRNPRAPHQTTKLIDVLFN